MTKFTLALLAVGAAAIRVEEYTYWDFCGGEWRWEECSGLWYAVDKCWDTDCGWYYVAELDWVTEEQPYWVRCEEFGLWEECKI